MFSRDIGHNWNWLYNTGELCVTRHVFDAYRVSSHLDNIRLYTVVYKGMVLPIILLVQIMPMWSIIGNLLTF